jgi:ABC-type ATPase involved in cell division
MSESIIEVKHLYKVFGELEVLRDISFSVDEGEVVCVIGPSGSGKSTLLRCLNKLEETQGGDIVVLSQKLANVRNINHYRENIGMVFQHFNLFPNYTVLENVMLAPVMLKKMSKEQAREKALELLDLVGLKDKQNVYLTLKEYELMLERTLDPTLGIVEAKTGNVKAIVADGIYTLSGMKVGRAADMQNMKPGLYIVNGKKYLVK